jgi:tripartite-type tricarboxylate transporter receptor subunit TctC
LSGLEFARKCRKAWRFRRRRNTLAGMIARRSIVGSPVLLSPAPRCRQRARDRHVVAARLARMVALAATLFLTPPGATAPAGAQDWPLRPVTMVVSFAAGGGADVMGRILAQRLSELLHQQVIVENVGGAGGMTGTNRVARAAPDGYQLALGSVGTHAYNQTLYKKPLYNAATDFAPVALIAETPQVLVTRKDLPAGDLREFVAYAKVHQGEMQYGSAGTGSPTHLACSLLNAAIGIDVTHIPYRGAAPTMQDLIAGRIDYQCPNTTVALPQIEAGTIKAIAILTRDRSPILPELASTHEQGLTGFEASIWYAFFLPRGTPAAIVGRLHDAAVATMETPAVQARLKDIGATVVAPERRSPEYLQKFVESEIAKWAVPIKAANITGE